MEEKQNLCKAAIGGVYKVCGMELPRATKMRLTALGLTAGTQIKVLNNKRSGSVIFHVRGTRLAVGRKIAERIYIG
ncbi:MAG: ferrous iron transport protein A [Lachnospiraceae bacterium]|nr:ferrous iron transport protein A [Lachnospiraceae bacterium]